MYFIFFQPYGKCSCEASWLCLSTGLLPVPVSLQDVSGPHLATVGREAPGGGQDSPGGPRSPTR